MNSVAQRQRKLLEKPPHYGKPLMTTTPSTYPEKYYKSRYGVRRVYDSNRKELRLQDRMVELGNRELAMYTKIAEWLPSNRPLSSLEKETALGEAALERVFDSLKQSGLIYDKAEVPSVISGEDFHKEFTKALPSWLSEAFSHPFWEKMVSGAGSRRLFSGWMVELYHYTRNANRHMPLSCAHTQEKSIKTLRAKHYAEEWNHYHYFLKSLKVLGYTETEITESVPLPMTLALSNFMRQAARDDVLAYSICSAVLEGTTTDRSSFNPYYEKAIELYGIPREAINPIYAHLDLDIKYGHSDLFYDILKNVKEIPAARAAKILNYGHQLVEHIWLWTDNIEKYYEKEENTFPRRQFEPNQD